MKRKNLIEKYVVYILSQEYKWYVEKEGYSLHRVTFTTEL